MFVFATISRSSELKTRFLHVYTKVFFFFFFAKIPFYELDGFHSNVLFPNFIDTDLTHLTRQEVFFHKRIHINYVKGKNLLDR